MKFCTIINVIFVRTIKNFNIQIYVNSIIHPIYKSLLLLSDTDSIQKWRNQGRSAIWIKVPILQSHLIPEAANQGFEFHHAEHHHSLLKLWLQEDKEDLTPRFATHQVGVSGQHCRIFSQDL